MSASSLAHELEVAKRVAREAGALILEVYATAFTVVDKPGGAGPVTEADRRANAHIVRALTQAFPGDGVVAEETADTSGATAERCWWVDPLDGTREFVARNGMFAVHVGLSIGGEAVLGVVYRPTLDRLWAGVVGEGCTLEIAGARRSLHLPRPPGDPAALRLIVSRSHKSPWTQQVQDDLGIHSRVEMGSVGLKCGALAEGGADLYLHPSPYSYRWDACAPEAVLRAAGGVLTDLNGAGYRYDGEGGLRNDRGLIGCHPALLPRVLEHTRGRYQD
ncbi:MAG TPA: 3'(2'),5'-bisphosphate nucleotidase CysQ [Myxococcaceae bacterium]|nr:3'(2'),5'-bisphosphate nucleotidase CysQ [Myxococcaceae bacterium]